MRIPGKTLKEMHNSIGTMELAEIMGCGPRNVRHLLAKSDFEFRFRRSKGKWVWIKYQEGEQE